jgi:uncharacterized membrane protein
MNQHLRGVIMWGLWNKYYSRIKIKPMNQHLKKVIIWRSISFPTATTIAYMYLGELARSITLSFMLVVILTTMHFIFESLWNKYVIKKSTSPEKKGKNFTHKKDM